MSDPSDFELDDDEQTAAEGHAAAEGVEPVDTSDVGSQRTIREIAFSTSPSEPLESVESPWDPERGGMTRIMRGIQKATNVDGLPAIADIGIGIAEWWTSIDLGDGDDNEPGDIPNPGGVDA